MISDFIGGIFDLIGNLIGLVFDLVFGALSFAFGMLEVALSMGFLLFAGILTVFIIRRIRKSKQRKSEENVIYDDDGEAFTSYFDQKK